VIVGFPADTNRPPLLYLIAVTALSFLLSDCATVARTDLSCDNIEVISNELSIRETQEYCQYAASERKKVEAFWGATWTETIRIHVDNSYRVSRALTTGVRGFVEMPLGVVRAQRSALLHEIVHVYAPNTSRFLAEGLAVYLQDTLGGNPAFPNFGKDLRLLTRDRLSGTTSLEPLAGVKTPRPLRTVMHEQSAYILAGSFVAFLIENYGLAMFRHAYEVGSYDSVYGKSLATLEKEWRVELQQ
jgi:hypothetical protein